MVNKRRYFEQWFEDEHVQGVAEKYLGRRLTEQELESIYAEQYNCDGCFDFLSESTADFCRDLMSDLKSPEES